MGKRLLSFASLAAFGACVLVLSSRNSFAGAEDENAKALIAVDKDWS